MTKLTRWMRFTPLMIGVLALLVLGWTPAASAGKGGHRKARMAERAARMAERIAEKKAAWEARKAVQETEPVAESVATETEPAAESVGQDILRGATSKVIGPEGGVMMASYWGGRGGKDDVGVQFKVPVNALPGPVEITMTLVVDTQDLSNLTVVFAPSGLKFDIPARLTIRLGKDVAEGLGYQSMVALHQSGSPGSDGELVEAIPLTINPGRKSTEVGMDVPGFSRYSLKSDGNTQHMNRVGMDVPGFSKYSVRRY